jgi:hypothetical protein
MVVWLLIVTHVVALSGCATTTTITLPPSVIPVASDIRIASVVLKDGTIIEFDVNRGMYVDKVADGTPVRAIVGKARGRIVEIDPQTAKEVRFEQTTSNAGGSFLTGFLLGLPVGAVAFYLFLVAAFSGH